MTQFKFLYRKPKYEDLEWFAKIEYNHGWCDARAGKRVDESPYGDEFNQNWLMGYEEYHRYIQEPIEITFKFVDNDDI